MKILFDVTATLSNMINPFSSDHDGLVNTTSGIELQKYAAKSLLDANSLDEDQFTAFCKDNLLGENCDIYAKIKRNILRTFSCKSKKVTDNLLA